MLQVATLERDVAPTEQARRAGFFRREYGHFSDPFLPRATCIA